ncbi:MAG: roadblock/LC7 domain-containing protein [Anaerolineales bacterium]|jgi:predicted regulator of Ras-like GTPase activity (Roadblock/LC7/MglB family)
MATTRAEEMVKRLREMQSATPEIEASAVVSVDGLTMASALPNDVEEDRVSAMSAAMLSLGERIATELSRGSLDQVYIHGDDGYVILSAIGTEAVLTALAKEKAKLGLVFLEMRRAAEDLAKFVGS